MKNIQLTRRLLLGTLLGTLFGILCFAGFSANQNLPKEFAHWQVWSWSNLMMWSTIANRALLGSVVALAGFITVHPLLKFKIPVSARGLKTGAWVSLPMALGALMGENHEAAVSAFWIIMIAGAIIGMIIDLIITKFAGDGNKLYEEK